MDVVNVRNFVRRISRFDVAPLEGTCGVWTATITGNAFLYHQVRCMMAVLLEIGAGNESADVISHLLDVQSCVAKPQYPLASDLGLVLWDCHFPGISWSASEAVVAQVTEQWTSFWHERLLLAAIGSSMSTYLTREYALTAEPRKKGPKYVPLLSRPREKDYESLVQGLSASKRQRLEANLRKSADSKPVPRPLGTDDGDEGDGDE
eukprot:TRINITY_DN18485_c0_g1_i2.p1 TRINITY_DN18485_c0_g1~~TRINITY_DN18485_c0_g1_i2.p1  ORF type:complete len:206 (+),score=26.54 TRINITY_DN18485_c0_g1_i2:646-1263(+)